MAGTNSESPCDAPPREPPYLVALFPFDLGYSYYEREDWHALFKQRNEWPCCEKPIWKWESLIGEHRAMGFKAFPLNDEKTAAGTNQKAERNKPFQDSPTPMGWAVAVSVCPESLKVALAKVQHEKGLVLHNVEAEVVFFSTGLAILVLYASLNGQSGFNVRELFDWRTDLRTELDPVLREPIHKYRTFFTRELERLEEVDARDADKAAGRLKDSFLIFAVPGPDHIADAQSGDPVDIQCKAAKFRVRWAGTYIWPVSGELSPGAVRAAVVANIGWYTLQFLDDRLMRIAAKIFAALAAKNTRAFRHPKSPIYYRRMRVIRLSYLETIDALRHIRWTRDQDYVRLLRRIHKTWDTERLWNTVRERTDWLASYYDKIEADVNDLRGIRYSVLGFVIGGFSVFAAAGVMTDLMRMGGDEQATAGWFRNANTWLAMIPTSLGLVVLVVLLAYWWKAHH